MCNRNTIRLPDHLLQKLEAWSTPERYLLELEDRIRKCEQQYALRIRQVLSGGSSALVAKMQQPDATDVIVKFAIDDINVGADFANEVKTLDLMAGNGYAQLLTYDADLQLAILECLGNPLGEMGLSTREQLGMICHTLQASWRKLGGEVELPNALDILDWFAEFIPETWEITSRPCFRHLLIITDQCIRERRAAYQPQDTVLVHGDPHSFNLLQDIAGDGIAYKFIDPDGILAEPAYDLGVLMREWVTELASNPLAHFLSRCCLLSELTGVEQRPIWQWGVIQTVATGLLLVRIGRNEDGLKMLQVGEALCPYLGEL